MEEPRKRLLIALDGSERGMNLVRQIGRLDIFHGMEMVLFHVFSGVPEAYWDLAKEPQSIQSFAYIHAWEAQKKAEIQAFMDQAKENLISAGCPAKHIKIRIQQRKKGIARNIIAETRKGFDGLVLRRRGMGRFAEAVMGSVSISVLEKGKHIPLLIVGQMPLNHRFLIAVDESEGALRAVDFAGDFLKDSRYEVQITHVIRGGATAGRDPWIQIHDEYLEHAREKIAPTLQKASQHLIEHGFQPEQIATKILTGELSRAGALAQEAEAGDFGTIIMGRRGLSKVEDFFMGRVTNKVIHIARMHSVWIVP